MAISDRERALRIKLKNDFQAYARACLKIRTKSGAIVPMQLNRAQLHLHNIAEKQRAATGRVRIITVKGRQMGCSTLIEGRFYWLTTHRKGVKTFILTHEQEATNNLFEMARRFHDNCPPLLKPSTGVNNANELNFDKLDSGYKIGTAGNKAVGRSATIQLLHGCVAEDSLVVLSDGSTKMIKDILIGDMVITSSGAIAPVSNHIFTGEKQVYEIRTWLSNEPIEVSADHKILTQDGWKTCAELLTDDYIKLPTLSSTGSIVEKKFDLAQQRVSGKRHQTETTISLDYDSGYYFGYYLAEGHVKLQWKFDTACNVTFCYQENETFIQKADIFARQLSTSMSEKHIMEGHKKVTVYYGTFLGELTRQWFGRVESKGIPDWVFSAPKEFIKGLIDGYLDGDGFKTQKDKMSCPSIHERISRQIKRLTTMIYDGVPSLHRFERKRYDKPTKPVTVINYNGGLLSQWRGDGWKRNKADKYINQDGHKYVKIKSITPTTIKPTYDLEVDHPDHDFETTIGIISNSEIAYWANAEDHASGLLQAVPIERETEIWLESTANGPNDYFHRQWIMAMDGKSEFIPVFIPWFWQDEYAIPPSEDWSRRADEEELSSLYNLNDAQLNWRRMKIAELGGSELGAMKFQREYPNSWEEAFEGSIENKVIPINTIRSSVLRPVAQVPGYRPIWGLDVGGEGASADASALSKRCVNRLLEPPKEWKSKDLMQLVGLVRMEWDSTNSTMKPGKICVDSIGIGAGVASRLKEFPDMHDVIVSVNVGETKTVSDICHRLRDELWWRSRLWFEGADVHLPHGCESLIIELASPTYAPNSAGKVVIEKKEDMAKRGVKSPNQADSFNLTFAVPEVAYQLQMEERPTAKMQVNYDPFGRSHLAQDFGRLR